MNTFKCELLSVERIWRSDVSQGEDESANEAKWLADLRKTVEALGAHWPRVVLELDRLPEQAIQALKDSLGRSRPPPGSLHS